jgi:hypothetical protein
VLGTIVGGIEQGLFPARPGPDEWRPGIGPTFSNCVYCEYDQLCSAGRGEQWVQLKKHPELDAYVALSEGPAPGAAGDEEVDA